MSYDTLNYPTPDLLEGTSPHPTIIIGSGPSTSEILNYKDKIAKKFHNIIVTNYSFKWFDDIATHHLVTEKTSPSSGNKVPQWLHKGSYSKSVPRIVHWKGIGYYPQDHNLYKCTRASLSNDFDVRRYDKGFLTGSLSHQGFSLGTTMLCAIHLASMLGAHDVFMIGADLLFRDQYDHWYKDRAYRDPQSYQKSANIHEIVDVSVRGNNYKTTAYFRDSAKTIDEAISTVFKDAGISVYDFSDGLITSATSLNVEQFFK